MSNQIITQASAELAPLDQHPAAVYLAALTSPRSRRVMANALNGITDILMPGYFTAPQHPGKDASEVEKQANRTARDEYNVRFLLVNWAALRYQHTAAIRSQLAEHYEPSSVNRMLSALRGVLKAAWQLGYMGAEDYHRARAVENVSGDPLPAGRDLGTGEVLALANVCKGDDTPAGIRDNAMIGVLYSCGLRRAELVALDAADFDPSSGKLIVRHGKGNKARTVYAQNGALLALHKWLRVRGQEPGALFTPVKKNSTLAERANGDNRLTPQAVYYMLKKRAAQAGVKDFSPHDFRRTFVGDLLDRGADISTVQKLAGHANVTTTQRYDRRPEEVKKRAAALLHYPG